MGLVPAMRSSSILALGLAIAASAMATTLQQLSMEDMIRQSTGIVRARVSGSRAALRDQNIYTFYRLDVLETAKSDAAASGRQIEVAVPGGTVNGIHQSAIGSPELNTGSEYVVFLWTGKSGMTQIIGLSQGLFHAVKDASGNIGLTRPAADDLMLDQEGRPVTASAVSLKWNDLRARILRELRNGAGQ